MPDELPPLPPGPEPQVPRPALPFGDTPAPPVPPAPPAPPEPPTLTAGIPAFPAAPPPVAPSFGAGLAPAGEPYPMRYEVEYAERLSRWKTLLRLPLLIPVYVFDAILQYLVGVGVFIGWLVVFLRRKYPGWLFNGVSGALGWQARYHAYAELLTDRYPSFAPESSPVTLEYDPPPQGQLSRWRVLFWKLGLLLPHLFVLFWLVLAGLVVTVLAWFAILFTGRYPRGLFGFVTGINRWYYRVVGYMASFNDRFPPFSLSPQAGPGSKTSSVISGVIGLSGLGLITGGIIAAVALASSGTTTDVTYARLQQGQSDAKVFFQGIEGDPDFLLRLIRVTDPDTNLDRAFGPARGERTLTFELVLENRSNHDATITREMARLSYRDADGDKRSQAVGLVLVSGRPAPRRVGEGDTSTIKLVFSIPTGATPTQLAVDPPWSTLGELKYRFR